MNARLLIPLLALSACTQESGEAFSEGGINLLDVTQSEIVQTVFTVTWETDDEITSFIRYGTVGEGTVFETPTLDPAFEHEGLLVGVPEASDGWFELVGVRDGEETVSDRYTFTTGQLSADIPRPSVTMGDSHQATAGLKLAPVALDFSRWVTLMDEQGRLVWAWGGDSLDTQRARLTKDGKGVIMMDRIMNSSDLELVRVDFTGEEVWRITLAEAHHDFELITDESFLMMGYDVRDIDLGSGPQWVIGDQIFQYDLDGTRTDIWSIWDVLTPTSADLGGEAPEYPGARGWSHGNYLHLDRSTDQILTTMRDIDMAFAIDRKTGDVVWSMGGDHGELQASNGTPILKYPHSVWPTESGYAVFNQGWMADGDCSWAANVTIDLESGSADQVWNYGSPTCNMTYYLGNTQPLSADRTLVSFGKTGVMDEVAMSSGYTVVRYGLDAPAEFLYVQHIGSVHSAGE